MQIFTAPLAERRSITKDTIELGFGLQDPKFEYLPGQYIRLTIPHLVAKDRLGNTRDFSIISLPGSDILRVAFRYHPKASDFKKELAISPLGTPMKISGPHGSMILPEDIERPVVFLAGGIGITSFVSKFMQAREKDPSRRLVLLWSDVSRERAPYFKELAEIAASDPERFRIVPLFRRRLDADFIRKQVPDLRAPIWQIAGPPVMVGAMRSILESLGVSVQDIFYEEYRGYAGSPVSSMYEQQTIWQYEPKRRARLSRRDDPESFLAMREALDKTAIVSEADVNGNIEFVNDKFVEISKYTRDELIGQNHRILKSGFHSREFYAEMWNTISRGRVWRGEIRNRAKDGSFYWVDTSIAPILGPDGKPVRYISVRFVITDRKRVEKELQKYREHLELIVEERTRELLKINTALSDEVAIRKNLEEALRDRAEALAQAHKRKDEFIAILSHELRNPLAPIVTSLELLKTFPAREPEVKNIIDTIDRQTQNMKRLMDDLLDVSRVIHGKIELHLSEVDARDIVSRAVESVKPALDAAHHELSVGIPSQPIPLKADPLRLEQILVNLLNNAIKYTDSGGNIWLDVAAAGPEARISVRDTGRGFNVADRERMFDLFARGKPGRARPQDGLGIGLAISKTLARLHGGDITASSPGYGQGSEFVICLPLAVQPVLPGEKESQGSPPATVPAEKGLRIMVVDDVEELTDAIAMLLGRALGYRNVRKAYDGKSAVSMASEFMPQVVLLDIAMPGQDGFETLREMKKDTALAGTFFVAVTGFGQGDDLAKTEEAGFNAHLIKPVSGAELKKVLEVAEDHVSASDEVLARS